MEVLCFAANSKVLQIQPLMLQTDRRKSPITYFFLFFNNSSLQWKLVNVSTEAMNANLVRNLERAYSHRWSERHSANINGIIVCARLQSNSLTFQVAQWNCTSLIPLRMKEAILQNFKWPQSNPLKKYTEIELS